MDVSPLTSCRILIVDDEESNVSVLLRLLARAGYEHVEGTTNSGEVIERFRELQPDLLLLDLHMPDPDGFAILGAIREEISETDYLPVLVLTGDLTTHVRERALSAGARDFITKPFDVTEVLLRIKNLLETRVLHTALQEQNRTLEDRVRERTRELAAAQEEILHRLALAAEYRDDLTGRHAERVGVLSALLGQELGLPEQDVAVLRWSATLHDVGKIGIPDAILMKPGPLTPPEYDLMKSHVEIGARILSGSTFDLLRTAAVIALSHHERWDGSGYRGLRGEDIPLVGRIVAVADVYDSLTHERPYKHAAPESEAVEEIRRESGTHFDPRVVEAFEVLLARGDLRTLDRRAQGPGHRPKQEQVRAK